MKRWEPTSPPFRRQPVALLCRHLVAEPDLSDIADALIAERESLKENIRLRIECGFVVRDANRIPPPPAELLLP